MFSYVRVSWGFNEGESLDCVIVSYFVSSFRGLTRNNSEEPPVFSFRGIIRKTAQYFLLEDCPAISKAFPKKNLRSHKYIQQNSRCISECEYLHPNILLGHWICHCF